MYDTTNKIKGDGIVDSIKNSPSSYINGPNPVFVINKHGEFIAVNNAFCQIIGRSKEEILGINIGDASFLTTSARKKARYRNAFSLIGKETPVYTLDVIKKNGDVLLLEIDTKPHIKDEKVAGKISIIKKSKKIVQEKIEEKIELETKEELIEDISNLIALREKNLDAEQIKSELKDKQGL